jgi:uroporphyrinogen decarboxylase
MYRKYLKGPESRIFAAAKKVAPGTKIFMHSCGSIKRLIPDLIEAGVEILSSLQPLAFEMNSAQLKKEFGTDIVFHGGIDLQQAMVGTKEQIVAETLTRLRDYAPGGGYICAPSNHFTSDVPVENFFALYETAKSFRRQIP